MVESREIRLIEGRTTRIMYRDLSYAPENMSTDSRGCEWNEFLAKLVGRLGHE